MTMQPTTHSDAERRGFTLVELLVVVAIIALVVGVLAPSLQKVRRRGKAVVCLGNQRQWGCYFGMFLNDHDGRFEGLGLHKWMDVLEPYWRDCPEIYFCPSATKTAAEGAPGAEAAWEEDGAKGSYGTNYWIREQGPPWLPPRFPADGWWKTFDVRGASTVPVLLDSARASGLPLHSDRPAENEGEVPPYHEFKCMQYFCIDRHEGKVNCLLMDLSGRPVGLKQLWDLHWHRDWNKAGEPYPPWPAWIERF